MQGLNTLYDHVGRQVEWARLVDRLTPQLVDPATGGPPPGREEHWVLHTAYRMRVARDARDWSTATSLQRTLLDWHRDQAAGALSTPDPRLTGTDRGRIHSLAVAEAAMGRLLRDQGDAGCLTHYQQAIDLNRRIGARTDEAIAAHNIGAIYLEVPELRDLDQAERWFRYALDHYEEHDRLRRAQTTVQLGAVAHERFKDAYVAREPTDVLLRHLNTAATHYHDALDNVPSDATMNQAAIHNQLGIVYHDGSQPDTALVHYQQAIGLTEAAGNRYGAGSTRLNVAFMLARHGRFADALLYAQAALRDFEPYGPNAAAQIEQAERLIARLTETTPEHVT